MTTPLENLIEHLQCLRGPEDLSVCSSEIQQLADSARSNERLWPFWRLAQEIPANVSDDQMVCFEIDREHLRFQVPDGDLKLLRVLYRGFGSSPEQAGHNSLNTPGFRTAWVLVGADSADTKGCRLAKALKCSIERDLDRLDLEPGETCKTEYLVRQIRARGKLLGKILKDFGIPVNN